jgi:hypothetical protein
MPLIVFFPKGLFRAVRAPYGATVGAIANKDDQIHVFWRDFSGRITHSKHTNRWVPARVIQDVDPGFRFAVLQWEAGKILRIFSEDYVENILSEYRSDDGGDTWTERKLTQELARPNMEPAVTEKKPAETETKPTVTEKKPAETEKKPTVTETKPAGTEKKPTVTEKKPTVTEKK